MRIQSTRTYAILTGDVVGSSKLAATSRRSLQRALNQIDKRVRRAYPRECPLSMDVFRGDGWQLLVIEPGSALRIALFVRASLRVLMESKRVDTRISVGIGRVEFIPGENVSQGDGPAYRLSGQGLDDMSRQSRLSVRIRAEGSDALLDALVVATDALTRRWSARQAQAVIGALGGSTQESIAAQWMPDPVTQQAVAQHLDRANWFAVERALDAFESHLHEVK